MTDRNLVVRLFWKDYIEPYTTVHSGKDWYLVVGELYNELNLLPTPLTSGEVYLTYLKKS